MSPHPLPRRRFLAAAGAAGLALTAGRMAGAEEDRPPAQVAITLDLEMSRHYPRRGMVEWDYQKGNLDEPTKRYATEAARIVRQRGGRIHFFCVGRVLEQPDVEWLRNLADDGHPVGNHTYDHVNLRAATPAETQFRFRRAPWLVRGRTVQEILHENILLTNLALRERAGIAAAGFRAPGGFADGLDGRADLQQMLREFGFGWVSTKYPRFPASPPEREPTPEFLAALVAAQAQAQPFAYPGGLVEVPMSPISDVNAFRSLRWKRAWFLTAIRQGVEWAIRTGGTFDFLAHPSCLVVEDPEFETITLICDLVRDAGPRAALADLDTIARRVNGSL